MKTVKGVIKGVKKAFKAVTSSGWGKALLIGAAIFTGGAALGMWASPWASLNDALVSAAGEAAGTGTASSLLGGGSGVMEAGLGADALASADAVAASTAAAEAAGGSVAPVAEALAEGSQSGGLINGQIGNTMLANNSVTGTMSDVTGGLAGEPLTAEAANVSTATRGLDPAAMMSEGGAMDMGVGLNPVAQGMGVGPTAGSAVPESLTDRMARYFQDWFKGDLAKYGAIQAGTGLIKGAFTPNAKDIAQAQADARLRMEAEQRAALQPNFQVQGVQLPTPAPGQALTRLDGSAVYGPSEGPLIHPGRGLISGQIRRPT